MLLTTAAAGKQHPAIYPAIGILTLLPLYYLSRRYHTGHPWDGAVTQSRRPPSMNFTADWLDTQVVEPFLPSAIGLYCNTSAWRPKLIFQLDDANGGVGNIRSNVLDFLFFAIEAGASIMLPSYASRSDSDLSQVWGGRAPFQLFFDEEWFLKAMDEACPQMKVHKPSKDDSVAKTLPGRYEPHTRRMDEGEQNGKKMYLEHLEAWLKEHPGYTTDLPIVVNLGRTLWDIDTRSLPAAFRRNFGQVLRLNHSVRKLSALVVQNLAIKHALLIDPRDPIPPHAFYGAHLRTEVDAQKAGWMNEPNTNFSAQTDAYISHALKHDLRTLYVASGNITDLALFAAKAAVHAPPLTITHKLDLLPPSALTILETLTWDQQALIDFEVLQRCSVFGGFVKSSFSFQIAGTRAQWGSDMGRVVEPWRVTHEETGVGFDDGLSRVVGRDGWHEHRIPRGMWP
ncbi:hypothetical protein B0A48_13795 [Cryoendolithus antarcticus]|uniref:Alternative oxidase n=1 Tax=Cryoendolithus antarcticus TaxID=1507870 RepID=A0A1V8SMQ0_9PEZI|nr:hypothetical protein B0A48_13795 [Cryoendolithus antarcticus]